ncbi:MAG TPA: hypothetical protein GXZ85_00055 [Firmicutes bacterium]|jgi:hypothetical protein|nr:hypothetical protein [Bacillota bacterium]
MMRRKGFLAATLFMVLLFSATSVFANEVASQERIDLFIASQNMLVEERTPPRMKVGMVLSTLGTDSEVSLGVRVESRIGNQENISVITETTYLREEQSMAGFLSLKFTPFGSDPLAMYLGAGAGYANGFRFQAFAGVDLTQNLFAEIRYVNLPGGFGDKGLYLATGFQFTF